MGGSIFVYPKYFHVHSITETHGQSDTTSTYGMGAERRVVRAVCGVQFFCAVTQILHKAHKTGK
jgi:hypothetical protein